MHMQENVGTDMPLKLNSIPRAHAIPLSSYDYTSVNLILASAVYLVADTDKEVTHEVFFGENINRVKDIFKK